MLYQDGPGPLANNTQHTQNSTGTEAFGKPRYDYAILPNTIVPQETGYVTRPGPGPGEMTFVLPKSLFLPGSSPGTLAGGTFHAAFMSKDTLPDTPTMTLAAIYQASTITGQSAAVDSQGNTQITVTGKATNAQFVQNRIDVYRTQVTDPFNGVLIASVLLNPDDPNQHFNPATGDFSLTVNWNGLPDLAVPPDRLPAGSGQPVIAFFARINDGGNSLVDPLTIKLSNTVNTPNVTPTVKLNSPSGILPSDIFHTGAGYIQLVADQVAPGGFFTVFNASGHNISVTGDLPLSTVVTVSVDHGGFIGTGTKANVLANQATTIKSTTLSSPGQATTFLNGLKFLANNQFTGSATLTVTVTVTTASGKPYSTQLSIPLLTDLFFLDPKQEDVNTPWTGSVGNALPPVQLNFAIGFEGSGPYVFQVVGGSLPNGLTLSKMGLLSGTPTEPTVPADGLTPQAITFAAYDKLGTATTLTYQLLVLPKIITVPTPVDDYVSTNPGQGIQVFVFDNDLLPPGWDPNRLLYVGNYSQGAHGTVTSSSANGKNTIFYQPNEGFVGTDSFTHAILQGDGTTATVYVAVGVQSPLDHIHNQRYVTAVYSALLQRSVDSAGLAY